VCRWLIRGVVHKPNRTLRNCCARGRTSAHLILPSRCRRARSRQGGEQLPLGIGWLINGANVKHSEGESLNVHRTKLGKILPGSGVRVTGAELDEHPFDNRTNDGPEWGLY
jgi:hypothetical protein